MTKWENDYINERQEQRMKDYFNKLDLINLERLNKNQYNIKSSGNGSPVFLGSNAGKNIVLNITTTETFEIPEDKYYLPPPEEECKSCGAFDYEEKGQRGYFCKYCGKQYIFKKEIDR